MARKKKTEVIEEVSSPGVAAASAPVEPAAAPAVQPDSFLSGPVFDMGRRYFSRKDLNLLELSQLRVSSLEKDMQLKQVQIEKYLQEAQAKLKEMQEEVQKMKKAHGEKIEELKKVYLEIEKVYQISMRQLSYSEINGEIFEHKE